MWDAFIQDYTFEMPENYTRKLNGLLKCWYKVINDVLDKACPKRKANLFPAEMDWYNNSSRIEPNIGCLCLYFLVGKLQSF